MRLVFFLLLFFLPVMGKAQAQFVASDIQPVIVEGAPTSSDEQAEEDRRASSASEEAEEAPAVAFDPYAVTNVAVDVTAETASEARDQALVQAERLAYGQLCARFGAEREIELMTDEELAALVQSFEVQSERISAVRYIGVFTIHFNPDAVKERFAVPLEAPTPSVTEALGQVAVNISAQTLAEWLQIKQRLMSLPLVARLDTRRVQRGLVSVDVVFHNSFSDLCDALDEAGFALRQNEDGSLALSNKPRVFP
ncbi:MAG: hypothetical protein PHS57_09305 [Alphaproteobacteria bacterium]|nr:hypothetical protein [Alphaproteobacteria bacterium]